jgi:fatty acid desaturase
MTTSTLPTLTRQRPKFYSRHPFPLESKKSISALHELDNWHGILQIAEDWLIIGAATTTSIAAGQFLPTWVAVPTYLGATILIGARQRGLRVCNHQATHKALAKNPKLNYWLATLPAAWLVLESFSGFDDTHNSRENGHHPNLGTNKDMDHMSVVGTHLYDIGDSAVSLQQYLWTLPLSTPKYLKFLFGNRIFNPREDSQERVLRCCYFSAIAASLVYAGFGLEFLLYWLVPLFTTANWIGSFIQVAEHYPLMMEAESIDIQLSRNRVLSPLWNILVGTHQEGYHLVHHLYPKLPLWNMRKAHQILLADPDYASLPETDNMRALLATMARK